MKHFTSILLICSLVCLQSTAYSQDYFAIHFKYKPQGNYRLDQPSKFLTHESLARKVRFNVKLDSLDLPVSERYLSALQPLIKRNIYNSNWLNAAIVIADPEEIALIRTFPYVEKVVFIKPGSQSRERLVRKSDKLSNINYLPIPTDRIISNEVQNAMLGIDKMIEAGYRGKEITIAVFDAGFIGADTIKAFYRAFDLNKVVGRNMVELDSKNVYTGHHHGTNVLSLMAAYNLPQIISGAVEAKYILCITEDINSEYKIEEYNWVKAAEYADSLGVDIINSSLGYMDFDDPRMDYTAGDLDGKTAIITQGAGIAADKGILVVNSAGNYGRRGSSSITAPADAKGILSVGAVNVEIEMSIFSSQGPTADARIKPDLAALGESVFLLGPDGKGYFSQGTSFAAPQIAALAAGLWQAKPDWSKDKLIDNLLRSSSQAEAPDNLIGHGVPNFVMAYDEPSLEIPDTENFYQVKAYPNPMMGDVLNIHFGTEKELQVFFFDISGRLISSKMLMRTTEGEPFLMHIPALLAGVYVLEVRTAKEVKRVRVIKK
ncbi:S8 family peptidase [Anditalea andensis]|uniref:Peptidase S8/S53 domain-containing protein n=1 Tax=Anditalea andensis TaxID=1048983 RepID=A0A074KTV8_9BACT|nr:S8 family peptidase [Anditalea andensis]KEO72349.1 hypothetical protein EL17_16515 [Anditalea andensis]